MMLKRMLDESESFAKRNRLSRSTSNRSTQIEQNDDDHIEIVQEICHRTCQSPLLIILDTESDDEQNVSPARDRTVQTANEELIDLTEEETTSSSSNQSSIDAQECPVCLETLSDLQNSGVYLLITQCHHIMCMQCTRQLLALAPQCPLCRANVCSANLTPYCILT